MSQTERRRPTADKASNGWQGGQRRAPVQKRTTTQRAGPHKAAEGPTRNTQTRVTRMWLYLDAEVLVLPPVFLPQDCFCWLPIFVVIQLQTLTSPRARLTTPIYKNPSRRLAISQRAACIQACAADRRAVTRPPLRQTAQALLRNWQHQLWRPRWPPPAPPRGGPLRSGSSPPSPRPLNRGRQEQTAWPLRQQPPGLALR